MTPWYRQFWPWFIMLPAAGGVVSGLLLLWIALGNADDLVVDDYRKIGRATEQQFERDRMAVALGARARVILDRDTGAIEVELAIDQVPPAALLVDLIHPTEADRDLAALLTRHPDGLYRGRFDKAPRDRRYLRIVPPDGHWRLTGELLAHESTIEPGH